MRNLEGKRTLITGAASGIGRAIALALAARGSRLFLLDIDEEGLAETAYHARQQSDTTVLTHHCDLTDSSAISAAVQNVLGRWRSLDLLVNNAGIAYYGATHDMTPAQWDRVLAINLHAPIQLTRELLPSLLARPESHILNVCSIAGLVPIRRLAAYQVTKYGLVGLSQSLRAEYWGRGLGVTAMCPGFVHTNIYSAAMRSPGGKPLPKLPRWFCATPEKIAAAAVRAIRRNKAVITPGPFARLAWLAARYAPAACDILCRGRLRRSRRPMVIEPSLGLSADAVGQAIA